MKVIKAKDLPQTKTTSSLVNEKKVAELQEKFDSTKQMLDAKSYGLFLDAEVTGFLFENFFQNIVWKGAEAYVLSASYEAISQQKKEDGTIHGKVRPEIIEGVFHLIKNYSSTGIKNAQHFKQLADQFAIVIQEINQDRQDFKDLSLELVAAEKGISVEDLTGELQKDPNFLDK